MDFFITFFAAFSVYSTNYLASESLPILGSAYGVALVCRGVLPLLTRQDRYFRWLPLLHVSFLLGVVSVSFASGSLTIYLVGIILALFLGAFTGSYVFAMQVAYSQRLSKPTRFFSLITGIEALAFVLAPVLVYFTSSRMVFLTALVGLLVIATGLLWFIKRYGESALSPKFYARRLVVIHTALPLGTVAMSAWVLQYLWMGSFFLIAGRAGLHSGLITLALEIETVTYMVVQFIFSRTGLEKIASWRTLIVAVAVYGCLVVGLISDALFPYPLLGLIAILIGIAAVSVFIDPIVDSLTAKLSQPTQSSTVVGSLRSFGGGVGYTLASIASFR